MGHIMDADALYGIIWLERVVGGHNVPSVARMRHLSICHARLYCRSTALVCHRACRWIDGGWLCALWAGVLAILATGVFVGLTETSADPN